MPAPTRESPEVQNAYIVLAEFFGTYALSTALRYLRKVLRAAAHPGYWKGNPANVLFFYEKLQGLLLAALTIHQSGLQRAAAFVPMPGKEAPDIGQYEQYCGWHYLRAPWYFVPRHLSIKEYGNPYLVFGKLALKGGKKRWKSCIEELRYYSLGNSHIEEWGGGLNTLELYLLLSKLLEAAHLIEVRAITDIAGEPLPKWKGLPTSPQNEEA